MKRTVHVNPTDTMVSLAQAYLAERRCLGFDLKISGHVLMNFARFADAMEHHGSITEDLALAWAHSTPSQRPIVTFRRNGAGRFRLNDATGNEQLEGSIGDQGCLILPPFASSVLGDSTPGFGPR